MGNKIYIDFIYIQEPMVKSLEPYKTRDTYPKDTTWKQVKAERSVLRPIKREWPAYAWPGGYPLFYITEDNGILCPTCASKNLKLTLGTDPQWSIVAREINYEDDCLVCDNCSTTIEAAYGVDEGEEGNDPTLE